MQIKWKFSETKSRNKSDEEAADTASIDSIIRTIYKNKNIKIRILDN